MMSLNDQYLTQRNKAPFDLNASLLKTRNISSSATSSTATAGPTRLNSVASSFPMAFGLRFPSTSTTSSSSTTVRPNQNNFNYKNLPTFLNSSSTTFNKNPSRVASSANTSSSHNENLPFVSREKLIDNKVLFPNRNAFPTAISYSNSTQFIKNYTPNSLFNTLTRPSQHQQQQQQLHLQEAQAPSLVNLPDPETEFMNFLRYLAIIAFRLGKKAFVWILFILTYICSRLVKLIDQIPNPRITEVHEKPNGFGILAGLAESTPQLSSSSRFGQEQHPADQRISSILNKLVPADLAMSLLPPSESTNSTPSSGFNETPSPAKSRNYKGSSNSLSGIGNSLKQRLTGGGNIDDNNNSNSKNKVSELTAKLNSSKLDGKNDDSVGDDNGSDSVIVKKRTILSKEADKIKKGDKQYGTFFFSSGFANRRVSSNNKYSNVGSFNPSPSFSNEYLPPNLELEQKNRAENITNTIKNMIVLPSDNDNGDDTDGKNYKVVNMKFNKSSTRFKDLQWLKDDNVDYVENLESSELFKEYQKIMQERIKMRELLKLSKEEPLVHTLKRLTLDQLNKVESYWTSNNLQQQVIEEFNIPITIRDLKTLSNGKWLNDNIIDFYMKLIIQRSRDNSPKLPKIHAFSTHFYTNLSGKGYNSVKKWAKRAKVDVVQMDYIFVPVNIHGAHWALALIDNKNKRFQYYDSLFGGGADILDHLKTYMIEETKKQHGKLIVDYNTYGFDCSIKETPRQNNGFDCGVFTCTCVDYLSREQPLTYGQDDMVDLRERMAFEIGIGKLLDH